MNLLASMPRSTKRIGRFEQPLIARVTEHFEGHGYKAFPHVRFNIAWSSSLSDIDVLLFRDDLITVVEVKSKRDKISRAWDQINAISDYIDYAYVATERLPKSWESDRVGLLFVNESEVKELESAKRITGKPRTDSLFALPKKCLLQFLGESFQKNFLKAQIVSQVENHCSEELLRRCLKEIVLCHRCNEDSCPVLALVSNHTSQFDPNPTDALF